MDAARERRLAELGQVFAVTQRSGPSCPYDLATEALAAHLNRWYGRPVVMRRARTGGRGEMRW